MRSSSCLAYFALVSLLAACSGKGGSGADPGGGGGGGGGGGAGGSGGDDGGTTGDDGGAPGDDTSGDGGVIATGAVCSVASTGTSGLLVTGTLLLPAGPTKGELLVDASGKIVCADASCASAAGYGAATRLDCPGGVVSPSLINTHDHTEYATRGPEAHGTTRYQHRHDWRTGAEGATALPKVSSTTDAKTIATQELRFVMGGATAVVGSGGVGGFMRNLADYSNQQFLEGLSGKTVYFDTFPMGDSNGTLITSGCGYPSVRKAGTAFQDGMYAPHIAEGINLAAQNELTCANGAAIVTSKTAIIHGVGTNANDIDVISKAGAKLVWAPRSNIDLYGDTAPVTEYHTAGVTIALGTDWLASGSMNMLRELSCADSLNQKYFHAAFTDQELWEMVTKNAAIATGFDDQLGTLEAGKLADIAIFDGRTNHGYRAVIGAASEDVRLVLRGGKALYGDADLVGAVATGCTALDVCGNARSVCVDVPSVTLADIQTTAGSIYPLFFCRGAAPTDEPSCTPYRDSYPNGTSSTDRDGDGVDDASDDCPDVFDPPRPMDANSKQADVDGDGAGDVCDAKPLDAASR